MKFLWFIVPVLCMSCQARDTLVLPSGDVQDGKVAFDKLGCSSCHAVYVSERLEKPVAKPRAPTLGGQFVKPKSDGQLVTAILNPSHAIKPAVLDQQSTAPGGKSRMGDFSEAMTTRELVDIVAFLKTRYQPR